ncbi:MAG: hypothetical protein HYR56_20950 [Acidobacteria bacterium]|nr:hypothetical protein [Acidobacteriota bacterium]MBI3425129.1 hypothetical protein [Acidobacteriota bacterium]
MKKLSLLLVQALLWGAFAFLPSSAKAQDNPQAEFERTWYATCYPKPKDESPECYQMSKELRAKFPGSTYVKNANGIIEKKDFGELWEKFKAALAEYYAGPDSPKLEKLLGAGDAFLAKQPDYPYVVAQQALAGSSAALGEMYKDKEKAKSYMEKALKLFDPSAPAPADEEAKKQTAQFREDIQALGNQYLGWYVIQTNGDPQQALAYLGKSIAVKGKDNIGVKDPNNYWLRSTIYNAEYGKLSKQYQALPDDQKTGDAGKEVLKQINTVVDKLIAEYARVIAVATAPSAKPLLDAARESFNSLWKYRTDAPEKGAAYLKNYQADPAIPDVEVPAKAETSMAPPTGPPTTGGPVKLNAGAGGAPGGSGAVNGTKAAPAKGKAAPVKKKRR